MADKLQDIISSVEKLTIAEMAELVKAMEEKFGVSAAVAVAGGGAGGGDAEEDEKSAYDVVLSAAGDQKIQVIKVIREALEIGLKEAKDMADGAPGVIKEGLSKADAEDLKGKLEAAGGSVELK